MPEQPIQRKFAVRIGTLALSIALLAPHSLSHAREKAGVYSIINSTTYSEIMSIDGFINDFSAPLKPGTRALTFDHVEMGVAYGNWRIGRVMRYDYALKFSEDTALINFQIERNIPIDDEQNYHVKLEAEHLRSQGLRVSRAFQPRQDLSLTVGLSWLESEQFYSGEIQLRYRRDQLTDEIIDQLEQTALEKENEIANAQTPSEIVAVGESLQILSADLRELLETTQLSANADYHYYKPALREDEQSQFQDVDLFDPNGQGFTLDFALHYQHNEQWSFDLAFADLYSRIVWDESPATRASINATRASLEAMDVVDQFIEQDVIRRADGQFFTSINPQNPDDPEAAIPGFVDGITERNSQVTVKNERFTQRLPRRIRAAAQYAVRPWLSTTVSALHTPHINFFHLRADLFDHVGLEYHPTTDAFGFELYHPIGRFRIISDSTDFKDAQFIALEASLLLVF